MVQEDGEPLRLFLRRLTTRSVLTQEECAAILSLPGREDVVATNRDVVSMGQQVTEACVVLDGLIGRFAETAGGERQFVELHIPGDAADLHSVVSPQVVSPLQALTRARILRVPHKALVKIATEHPAIAHAFWRDSVVDASIIAQAVLSLGRRRAIARLAHLLCEMTLRYEQIGAKREEGINFPINQPQLADALGLTPIHVNRMVRTLRERGVATFARGLLTVQDWDGLVAIAEFDPVYLQFEPIDRHEP